MSVPEWSFILAKPLQILCSFESSTNVESTNGNDISKNFAKFLTSAVQDDVDIIRMEWLENSREKNWFNTDFILKC